MPTTLRTLATTRSSATSPGLKLEVERDINLSDPESLLPQPELSPEEKARLTKQAEDTTQDIIRFLTMKEESAYQAACGMRTMYDANLFTFLVVTDQDRQLLKEERGEEGVTTFSWPGYCLCRLRLSDNQANKYLQVARRFSAEVVAAIGVERAYLYDRWLNSRKLALPASPLATTFETARGSIPLGDLSYREASRVFTTRAAPTPITPADDRKVKAVGREAVAIGVMGMKLTGVFKKKILNASLTMPLDTFAALIKDAAEARAARQAARQNPVPASPASSSELIQALTQVIATLPSGQAEQEVRDAYNSLLEKLRAADLGQK